MSYDILFVPRRPDQTWADALDAAEGTDVLTVALGPERRAQWERVVDALRRRVGDVEVSEADDVCEATHVRTGLQVSLFPDEAALTFPYWEREDADSFHDTVVDVVGIVERETGLSAWDAQADAPFDGRIHDQDGVAASRRLTRSGGLVPGPVTGHTGDGDEGPEGAPRGALPRVPDRGAAAGPRVPDTAESAQDRRRAMRYLALGAVVVIGALLWRAQVGPSLLNGVALAVGVADLVIGGLLLRGYQRRRGHP